LATDDPDELLIQQALVDRVLKIRADERQDLAVRIANAQIKSQGG